MRVQLPLPGLGVAGAAVPVLPSSQEGAELGHWVSGDEIPGVPSVPPRALWSLQLTRAAWLPIVPGALGRVRKLSEGQEAESMLRVPGVGARLPATFLPSR